MKILIQKKGFTLTQMLVVITILAVLTMIAYPTYQNHVRKGRLSEAQQILLHNAQNLERHYAQKSTFKKNSTTWVDLTQTQNNFFCFKMQGNPRGIADNKFTIKAVALNKQNEPRVLTINQDHMMTMCESSESICNANAYFTNSGRSDKNCTIIN